MPYRYLLGGLLGLLATRSATCPSPVSHSTEQQCTALESTISCRRRLRSHCVVVNAGSLSTVPHSKFLSTLTTGCPVICFCRCFHPGALPHVEGRLADWIASLLCHRRSIGLLGSGRELSTNRFRILRRTVQVILAPVPLTLHAWSACWSWSGSTAVRLRTVASHRTYDYENYVWAVQLPKVRFQPPAKRVATLLLPVPHLQRS